MKCKFFLVIFFCAVLAFEKTNAVLAEQSGSSPESGTTSKLKGLYSSVTTLGFGSDAAGSFGNLGSVWNRVYSASTIPPTFSMNIGSGGANVSGCASGGIYCFPQSVGGVDDYNNGGSYPADSYKSTWTACNSGNSYCGTGRSVAEKKDNNTGLVWSPRISSSSNWFTANNCAYPNGLPGDDGACGTNGEVACVCVKNVSSKTGCEGYDDGNWRLPNEKELMQVYIDGSYGNLTNPTSYYWSATTVSNSTQYAWYTILYYGNTTYSTKTNNNSVRCVR